MKDRAGSPSGRLYGIGVGPGDPELLTVKAVRLLQQVPVVVVPRKTGRDESYAYSIVSHLVDKGRQEVLPLVFPMKKDLNQLRSYWREACEAIHQKLAEGKDCAFITEGDPLLFGTFIYVYEMLKDLHPEIPVEIVPGVSSVTAAAATAQVPLVSGDGRLAILPATYEGEQLRATLRDFDTVVLMKVSKVFATVRDLLNRMDRTAEATFIVRAGMDDERIYRDISQVREEDLNYFSLMIVRKR